MTQRKIDYWVIPPEADASPASLQRTWNKCWILIIVLTILAIRWCAWMSSAGGAIQLLKEMRTPVLATCKHPRRVDYEYERCGTASIFMFCEPLVGWRQVSVRERRTKIDWAMEVEELLKTRYASAQRVTLVSDHLNTHTIGAFYEAFDPERARAIVRRLDFCYTPRHGSWLNIAENELSSMTRQCITGRRFATIDQLRVETSAWHSASNANQRGVDWQFKIDDARIKLKSVYPKTVA